MMKEILDDLKEYLKIDKFKTILEVLLGVSFALLMGSFVLLPIIIALIEIRSFIISIILISIFLIIPIILLIVLGVCYQWNKKTKRIG